MIKDSSIFKANGTRISIDNREFPRDNLKNGSKLGPVSEESEDHDEVADRMVREMTNQESEGESVIGDDSIFLEGKHKHDPSEMAHESILWS